MLASDAAHLYANINQGRPFPVVYNVGDMLEGHRRCFQLASSPDHVIPGHDPLVLKRYPPLNNQSQGFVHRLDVPRVDQ